MPKVISEAFTYDALHDQDVVQEAHQLDMLLVDIIDAVPRFEPSVLIALAKRFCEVCEQADIDPMDAFAQVADGVLAEEFEPMTTEFVHEVHSTIN